MVALPCSKCGFLFQNKYGRWGPICTPQYRRERKQVIKPMASFVRKPSGDRMENKSNAHWRWGHSLEMDVWNGCNCHFPSSPRPHPSILCLLCGRAICSALLWVSWGWNPGPGGTAHLSIWGTGSTCSTQETEVLNFLLALIDRCSQLQCNWVSHPLPSWLETARPARVFVSRLTPQTPLPSHLLSLHVWLQPGKCLGFRNTRD